MPYLPYLFVNPSNDIPRELSSRTVLSYRQESTVLQITNADAQSIPFKSSQSDAMPP